MQAQNLRANRLPHFDTLIIMGGPMGVYEGHPFLREEVEVVKRAVREGKKVLGVCLGGQVLSASLGGEVRKGTFGQEVGIGSVKLLPPLSQVLVEEEVEVLHWHGDTFTLPQGASLLGYSPKYFQAFRVGRALGLQFHLEVDAEMVGKWVEIYGGSKSLVEQVREREGEFREAMAKILEWWINP